MQVQTDLTTGVDAVTRKTAEYLGMVAGYVKSHDINDMLQDANRLVRRFPEHSLIFAAATGLVLGAAIRRK
jgi:ElaB/YqjD/DUF883 family membrane-anchored ribosome-binding protein